MIIMNKLFIATISAYLILWFMSSCATKGLYEDSLNKDSRSGNIMFTDGLNNPIKIEPYPIDIIPPSLGVKFYRDGIVFLSESKNEGKMPSGYLSFGIAQAYYAPIEDTTLGQRIIFSPKVPFPYPCDALSFSNNFGTMYFTKQSEKDKREKIFRAELFIINEDKQDWTFDTEPLEFCKEGSIYSHPSISVDGSMMIFSSNNPGSSGGMDLFITRNENMKWSEPKNLGKIINTAGNEIFPALDINNNLFFSSDGLPGYGGYDIFICKYNGKGWNSPVKMTKSINSKNDEFAFTIDCKSGKSAFFTSRKTSKNAEPQLYRISLNEKLPVIENKDLSALLYDVSVSELDPSELKLMAQRLEEERMRADSIETARVEAERIKTATARADSIANAKLNAQRIAAARVNAAKMKADSITASKQMSERLKAERLRVEKLRADSISAAKLAAERIKTDKLKADKIRSDSIAASKLTAQRLEAERLRAAKIKSDSIVAARLRAEKLEAERLKAARTKADSLEASRIKAERIKADSLAVVKMKAESIEAARRNAERLESERIKAVNKLKDDSIQAVRLAAQKLEAERIKAANKLRADSIAAAKLTAGRIEAARIRAERLRADSLEAARLEAARKANPDIITYKVQFISTVKPKGKFKITVDGVVYNANEYFYLNEYRYTIGEFTTLDPAKYLQYGCRRSGYPQAFVVAFRNGVRTLDMELFK
jgi:hypothetical protein